MSIKSATNRLQKWRKSRVWGVYWGVTLALITWQAVNVLASLLIIT